MNETTKWVDLGFAEVKLPAGTHICQIYSDEDERNDSLLHFLVSGLLNNESTACFSDNINHEALHDRFSAQGLSLEKEQEKGAFTQGRASEVYFQKGCFNPDTMLKLLSNFHLNATEGGYSGSRVIGEMTAEINRVDGGSRLLEYESRVSLLLRDHPITAVCQYNAHNFDGAMIMDVLKVHPMMVIRGSVIHNPFYISPEEFFGASNRQP